MYKKTLKAHVNYFKENKHFIFLYLENNFLQHLHIIYIFISRPSDGSRNSLKILLFLKKITMLRIGSMKNRKSLQLGIMSKLRLRFSNFFLLLDLRCRHQVPEDHYCRCGSLHSLFRTGIAFHKFFCPRISLHFLPPSALHQTLPSGR